MSSIDIINKDISNCISKLKSNLNIIDSDPQSVDFDYIANFRTYYIENIDRVKRDHDWSTGRANFIQE